MMRKVRESSGIVYRLLAFASIAAVVLGEPSYATQSGAHPVLDYNQARHLIAARNYDAAIDVLHKIVATLPGFDRAYLWLAYSYRESARHDDALRYFEFLVSANPGSPYPIYGLGVYRKLRREYAPAIELFKECTAMAPAYLPVYTDLAESAYWSGGAAAVEQFLRSRIQQSPETSGPRYGLSYLFRLRSDWANTERCLREAAQLARDEWEILSLLYETAYNTDRYDDALLALDRLHARLESDGDLERVGLVLGRKGMIHSDRGDYEKALEALQRAVALAREIGDRRREEAFQANLGFVYYYLARYEEGLAECRQALRLATELGLEKDRGRNMGLIGLIYADLADYAKAIDAFEQALRIARLTKDRASEADQMASISRVYSALGDHEKGFQRARAALAISKELRNMWLEGRFHQMLGSVYRNLGRHASAFESFRRGLILARQVGDKTGQTERLTAMSEVQAMLGNRKRAAEGFQEALEIAREIGARPAESLILANLAKLHLEGGDAKSARRLYQESLAIGTLIGSQEARWRAHAGLASAYSRLGNEAHAIEQYELAIQQIEDVRARVLMPEERSGFLADKLAVYRGLIRLLVGRHRQYPRDGFDEDAFRYAERAKARAFLDSIAESRLSLHAPEDGYPRARQTSVESRLSHLQTRLLAQYSHARPDQTRVGALEAERTLAEEEYSAFRREIRQRQPDYAAFRYPEPIGLDHARLLLGPREALLEYSVGPNGSFLFAVTRKNIAIASLPPARALARRVARLHESLSGGPGRAAVASYVAEAAALYRELIQPAKRVLAGIDALVIIPDGPLHLVPFAALLKEVAVKESGYEALPYLIHEYSVRYAPSASVLQALEARQESRAPNQSFAGFGNPEYAGETALRFARLANSAAEVRRIARLYPKASVFLGSRASEENVKAPAALSGLGVLHFAVHGIVDQTRLYSSGLALSRPRKGSNDDGLLQAHEIASLKLNADLVVLSGCETRLGKSVEGEGPMGLTQAFLYAGASTVVSTLWNVADRSSADLMERYHRSFGQHDKARALQRAQFDQIRGHTFSHPYFWAGFSVTGVAR